jgi:DUF4097 and DUF4098 domain-containing protein YvlB
MKTNAIVRIVLFSLAIMVLLGILSSVLLFRGFMADMKDSGIMEAVSEVFSHEGTDELRIDGTGYQTEFDATQIRNLEIDWVAGTIIIQRGNTNTIRVEESAVSDGKYQMITRCSGDKLILKFCEENVAIWGFSSNIEENLSKDLIITVPADWVCDNLEIDTASARVEVCDLRIDEVDFDGASGYCFFENCEIEKLDIDTASGDVEFSGSLQKLDFDAASAKFTGTFMNIPRSLDLDAMSGDMYIELPEQCGFEVNHDSMSGVFESDFQFTANGSNYKCGDGACKIAVSSMSGDIKIMKSKN